MAVRAGVNEADDGLEIPGSGGARTLRVALILLVDAALAAAGTWMIREHLRDREIEPAIVPVARMVADAGAQVVTAPATPPRPSPPPASKPTTTSPPPRRDPPPAPAPPTQPTPSERPAPERSPSRPPPVVVLPAIARTRSVPDAAPPPLSPTPPVEEVAATPDAAPLPDNAWIDSMTRGIRQVVEDHRDLIEDCYLRAAKVGTANAPVQGRVEVHLRIEPAGDASEVRVVENQTGSEELGACLVAIMKTWRYPAPGQDAMEFVWPFNFQSSQAQGQAGER